MTRILFGTFGVLSLFLCTASAADEKAPAKTAREGLAPFNTLIGSWYLSKLLARYLKTDNPEAYALADYNAGRSRVLQWIQGPRATNSAQFIAQIPFPGTRKYVETILERREKYRGTLKTP